MSVHQHQQLQQDIQTELNTTSRLLHLIADLPSGLDWIGATEPTSVELKQLKEFTSAGGNLDINIKENASTMDILGSFVLEGKVDYENIEPLRGNVDIDINMDLVNKEANQNLSIQEQTTLDSSNMDESG